LWRASLLYQRRLAVPHELASRRSLALPNQARGRSGCGSSFGTFYILRGFKRPARDLENYLHNFETILRSKWIQNCVCQGPRPHALKLGTSMGQKKDPTEIADGFCSQPKLLAQPKAGSLFSVCFV
jgi:hypothetical protein